MELDPHYVRALLRRAELYEKTEKLDEALEDYKAVLEKDPSVHQAREACMVSLSLSVNFGLTYLSLFWFSFTPVNLQRILPQKEKETHMHHLQICL